MDWRDEYEAAVIERNRLIMALTAAEARAKAETARANELEAALLMDYDELSSLIEALHKRVIELEARLAEQEWRPVTEDDWTFDGHQMIEVRETRIWEWNGEVWQILPQAVNDWRPLPPPPTATE